ncbi:MAG: hypothetical protein EXR81_01470 [Gammaproteobacteria bacterium]|nr:hypothetical protein [Gammaproteobacteria bacterium]
MPIRALFKKNPYLIIELSMSLIRLLIVQKTGTSFKILIQQEMTELNWNSDPAELTKYLVELVYNYKCVKTLVSIPSQVIQTQYLPIEPTLTSEEIIETVHLALEQQHSNLNGVNGVNGMNDYYFDFQVINPREVLVVTLEKCVIKNLLSVLQATKLEPVLITTQLDPTIDLCAIASGKTPQNAIINLLPWRTLQNQQKKNIFLLRILLTSVILIIFSLLGCRYLMHETHQEQKKLQQLQLISKNNQQLLIATTQINQENQEHRKQFNELQTLNARRYFLLRALDLFANKLPDGMYLTVLKQQEGILQIEGRAANHQAITQIVTALSSTREFKLAQLQFIKEVSNSNQLEFAIQVPEVLPQQKLSDGTTLE